MRHALLLVALVCGAASPLGAQSASRLIQMARAQLGEPNPDSAVTLLEAALQPGRGATVAEQARAFVLYGIAQLQRDNVPSARVAFRQALQRDATLRVDSLAFFSDALEREFDAERQALQPRAGAAPVLLTVRPIVPVDTVVPVNGGLLQVGVQPSYRARVVIHVTLADNRSAIVWADTQDVRDAATRGWNVRGSDGSVLPAGRYALRMTAVDSAGQVSPAIERILVVSRVSVDTADIPPPLLESDFAPEALHLKRGSPVGLAAGLAIAAGAAFVPSMLGNADLKAGASYTPAYAVAGAVSVVSVVGFLRGARDRPLPTNVLSNQQLRTRHAAEQQQVAQENARLRAAAPVRVRVEGQ